MSCNLIFITVKGFQTLLERENTTFLLCIREFTMNIELLISKCRRLKFAKKNNSMHNNLYVIMLFFIFVKVTPVSDKKHINAFKIVVYSFPFLIFKSNRVVICPPKIGIFWNTFKTMIEELNWRKNRM